MATMSVADATTALQAAGYSVDREMNSRLAVRWGNQSRFPDYVPLHRGPPGADPYYAVELTVTKLVNRAKARTEQAVKPEPVVINNRRSGKTLALNIAASNRLVEMLERVNLAHPLGQGYHAEMLTLARRLQAYLR